jgi:hypothetical protein
MMAVAIFLTLAACIALRQRARISAVRSQAVRAKGRSRRPEPVALDLH